MATQTQGNGTAQNQTVQPAQGQQPANGPDPESQQPAGGSANGGQSDQLDVEQLTKKIEGLESLVGRFSNEVGATRELKEEIQSLKTQVGNTEGGQSSTQDPPQSANQPSEDPLQTITTGEQQKVDDAWKQLDADVRKNVYAEAEGSTPEAKQKSITRRILTEVRTNEPVIPDSLFGDNQSGQENAGETNPQSQEQGTTADILKAIRGGNRQRPATGRQPQTRNQQSSQDDAVERRGPTPLAGGIFEAASRRGG